MDNNTLVILIIVFVSIVIAETSTILDYEPYTLLKVQKLVGFFPLDTNLTNIAPLFRINKYEQLIGNNSGSISSSITSKQDGSYYFDGSSYAELPISLDPRIFPRITIGAWIKSSITGNNSALHRIIFGHSTITNNDNCFRGIKSSNYMTLCSSINKTIRKTSGLFLTID
jgi:hypothetical protein